MPSPAHTGRAAAPARASPFQRHTWVTHLHLPTLRHDQPYTRVAEQRSARAPSHTTDASVAHTEVPASSAPVLLSALPSAPPAELIPVRFGAAVDCSSCYMAGLPNKYKPRDVSQFLENGCKMTASGPPLLKRVVTKSGHVKYQAPNGTVIDLPQHARVNKKRGLYHRNEVVPPLRQAGLLEAFMDSKYCPAH
eukprot:COSAG06_NODE_3671_length_5036_cov_3.267977_4_plen_193_part_00